VNKLSTGKYPFIVISDVCELGKTGEFVRQISRGTNAMIVKINTLSSRSSFFDHVDLKGYSLL